MSRTYRYDPEAGCGRGGKSEARRRDAERAASEAEPMPAAEGAFHGESAFPEGSARAGAAEMAVGAFSTVTVATFEVAVAVSLLAARVSVTTQ